MNTLVTVTVCSTRIEAELIKGRLMSDGIKAMISADDAGGMYPFPMQSGFSGVAVLVAKKDFVKAKNIIKKAT